MTKIRNFFKLISDFSRFFLKFLSKYYFIIIGLCFLYNALITAIYSKAGVNYKAYLFALAFASFTVYSEIRSNVKLIPFLCCAIPFLLFIRYISGSPGYSFWGKLLSWQISKGIVINLNPVFAKIPFNDGGLFRIYKSESLTWFLRLVYNNGFVLPVLVPIYRSAISKDFGKMLKYALSAHIFQVFLITPFYLMFHLQEVWYVLGQPDGLGRNLSLSQAAGVTLNCFPSMHTSIAFAMFLLVLREKNKAFKFVWGFFCLSVIFSTLYLEVHWVLDVLAGLLLAYCTVKLVDFVVAKGKEFMFMPLGTVYYKSLDSIYIKNYYLDSM
jgi:membrane-associated phospholipid phosphatase